MSAPHPERERKSMSKLERDILNDLPQELRPEQQRLLEKYIHQEFKFQQAEAAREIAALSILAKYSSSPEELNDFIDAMAGPGYRNHFQEHIEHLFSFVKNAPYFSERKCKQFCINAFEFKERISVVMKNRFSRDETKKLLSLEKPTMISWRIVQRRCHEQSARETEKRIWSEKPPTEEELRMGIFREDLEYPVRDALFVINRKGYKTIMSGFDGLAPNRQFITGSFEIDHETVSKLVERGVHVILPDLRKRVGVTEISFYPTALDMNAIKKKWDEVADLLPDLGHRSPPSPSSLLVSIFAPDRFDLEKERLDYELSRKNLPSEYEEELRRRLAGVIKKLENNA